METLIRNGMLVTESSVSQADLLIRDGKVAEVGSGLPLIADQVIDATGKYVLPGGVDVHAHLGLEMFNTVTSDDHYSGHKAAAFGGTTTVIDFVSHDAGSLQENIARWHEKAGDKAAVDYGFHMNITRFDEQIGRELARLTEQGITSIKVFTAYNDRFRLADQNILKAMRIAKDVGILTMIHAENGDIIDLLISEAVLQGHTEPIWHALTRPAWTAIDAAVRSFTLSAVSGAPMYLVHMNTAAEAMQLAYARSQGLPVMGETCPHYLFFTEDNLRQPDGAKFVCSPPLRQVKDQRGLWQGLSDGVIQVVSTDHCPFFYHGDIAIEYEGKPFAVPGKELGKNDFTKIPNGIPGLGDRMPVMWTKAIGGQHLSLTQFVRTHCANPARIFGLYPRKGCLIPGADADIVIWNPEKEVEYGRQVSRQRTDYNLYEHWQLKGMPEKVFLRGKLIVDGEIWHGGRGEGMYLHRTAGQVI